MEISKIVYKLMEDELMRMLFSEASDLTYIYDTKGNILFVNKIFEKFTGYRPEEYYGKPFASLFSGFNLKKAMYAYTRTLKGKCTQCELSFRNTEVLCEYKNYPLRDENRNIIGVMGIARDITARKQVEERLAALNESLEKRMVGNSARLAEVNEELTEEINVRKKLEEDFRRNSNKVEKSLRGLVQTMALAIESKDSYASGHQQRVAKIACSIAEEMGLSKERIDGLNLAALIHDIGKVSIPAVVLNKPGPLTETEFNMIKAHPQIGYDILKEIEFPMPLPQIVLQHHERIDGSGYPLGLSGKDTLLEAKILGVADVIEAMSSNRSYRAAISFDKVLEEISRNRGTIYDFNVVYACVVIFNEKRFKFEYEIYSNASLLEDNLLKV